MAEQPTHLTVIDGQLNEQQPETEGPASSLEAFPPLNTTAPTSNLEALETFKARLNIHKLDRLRNEHSARLFEAELNVENLKLQQAFELILFEASVNDVPYRDIVEAHSEAPEAFETVLRKVG